MKPGTLLLAGKALDKEEPSLKKELLASEMHPFRILVGQTLAFRHAHYSPAEAESIHLGKCVAFPKKRPRAKGFAVRCYFSKAPWRFS